MAGITDYGWDSSDDEGGMEIDLNPKAEEPAAAPEVFDKDNYDPSEPTDDYDPSEPTRDTEEADNKEDDQAAEASPRSPQKEADYDPAEPTLSDEEDAPSPPPLPVGEEEKEPVSPVEQVEREEEDDNGDGRWDSQAYGSDDELNTTEADKSELGVESSSGLEEREERPPEPDSKGTSPSVSPKPSGDFKAPLDTDDNTQTSVAENEDDNFSDIPEVTIDDSDFVLEKEPFDKDKEDVSDRHEETLLEEVQERVEEYLSDREEVRQERERTRRQEEIDSRNEEALVDLFREESDPDKIADEETTETPQKKTKKKVGSKKLKKKGKKVKKGQGKKGSKGESGDQRFVEIRRERQSLENWEEGELEGEAEKIRRKLQEDRAQLELYDKAFESTGGLPESDEQREPGEIVEMEGAKKRGVKKKDKKEKKKKKSRREVATIEEGGQEDDSQKFPSFLAGFFVQDEELDENVDLEAAGLNQAEVELFHKEKSYRKRHDSGAEDSVKSFDQNVQAEHHEVRVEESDHRRVRRHEERRHDSRERRHEGRDTREVRREREHRHEARERERDRGRAERERAREKERLREREREMGRERNRRSDGDERMERRRNRSRSRSQERRRRSDERRSRDRSSRHRRHRSRSRDRSGERENRERERERERERSRRRHRDRSREREPERWVRRQSGSRSRSPHRRSERASSNKENREESSRRRHREHQEDSESEEPQESHRGSQRRHHHQRHRERAASSSSSSSSSSEDSRNKERRHQHHHHHIVEHHSSDEGASSDVILVEPERIVIDLDLEEDPPSRVDITHGNTVDDSTTLVDGESIPPPPELSDNARSSALIQINPAPSEADGDASRDDDDQDADATPTRDEPSDATTGAKTAEKRSAPAPVESDYDPAHPTEEAEEREDSPVASTTPSGPSEPAGPVPPDHPPPEEVRPSPPPESATGPAQQPPLPMGGPMGQRPPFQPNQPPPPSLPLQQQQQPGLLPFPPNMSGANASQPPQRFPWQMGNGPRPNLLNQAGGAGGPPQQQNMLPQNNGPAGFPPGHPQGRGLLPMPEGRAPIFPVDNVRPNMPFPGQMNQGGQMLRDGPPPQSMVNSTMGQPPVSSMAPLAQLTSLLPALERAKMAAQQQGGGLPQQQQPPFKALGMMPGQGLLGKGPLTSSSNNAMPGRGGRGSRNGGAGESTEVVDMDMSPGEDDCELELPSPTSDSGSDSRGRRRSSRRDHGSRSDPKAGSKAGGNLQPTAYVKALSKMIEKLTHKGQPQQGAASASSGGDRGKQGHRKQKPKLDLNDDDVPASAVDLTNKEKFMKKLHLQERVIDEVKLAIKPFYASKKISKEQYKLILRKAVPKICHSKSGNINPQKIQQLVEAYVGKMRKGTGPGGAGGKKKKGHPAKEGPNNAAAKDQKEGAPAVRQNGERPKKGGR